MYCLFPELPVCDVSGDPDDQVYGFDYSHVLFLPSLIGVAFWVVFGCQISSSPLGNRDCFCGVLRLTE